MTWAVRYYLSDQRDGDYCTYSIIENLEQLAAPDGCRRIELVRMQYSTVAEAAFQLEDRRQSP